MNIPTTIKGYISIIKMIDKITLTDKKGFEKLPKTQQDALLELSAAISNRILDITNEKKKTNL